MFQNASSTNGRGLEGNPKQKHVLDISDESKASTHANDGESEEDNDWWTDEVAQPTKAVVMDRTTRWPSISQSSKSKPITHISSQMTPKKPTRKYSVQLPSRKESRQRQKIQNARAGIKVVTNFSRHHGPAPIMQQASRDETRNVAQGGMFVDLAALQALEKGKAANNNSTGFWSSLKASPSKKLKANHTTRHARTGSDSPTLTRQRGNRGKDLIPPTNSLNDELSPNDRPIFIGLSIPPTKIAQHTPSLHPQGYSSSDNPETPTIVITPAQDCTAWDPLASTSSAPRAASSVYSRATSFSGTQDADAPPVPKLPSSSISRRGRESTGTLFDEDLTPATSGAKERIMSSCTIFEEDSTPILTKITSMSHSDIKHTSISPLEKRASNGWWNFITTPFLTRSNTLASPTSASSDVPPAVPSLDAAGAQAISTKTMRDWEKSAFSPLTPETTTTISSDAWWDRRNTLNGMSKDELSPEGCQTYDSQSGTLPFMLGPSQTVIDRSRNITNQEPMPSDANLGVQRDLSTRSALSPSDRVAPVMLDMGSLAFGKVQVQNNGTVNTVSFAAADHIGQQSVPDVLDQERGRIAAALGAESTGPPPYSPPRQVHIPKYRAVFPPGHHTNTAMNLQEPPSPGPTSPGLQRAMASNNSIAMSDVPLTPAPRRPINLNSGYNRSPQFITNTTFDPPPKSALKAEKKRKRYEKEDKIAHKAGGLWRGRGCVSQRGCYGRSGAEGRKRRRCWFGLIAGFLAMIILIVVLATQLHHNSPAPQPSQWLNLTSFPPMYTGLSTVAAPDNPVAVSACAFPATMWSCALPKEVQLGGSDPTKPSFRFQIQWDNSTEANQTANSAKDSRSLSRRLVGNPVSAGQFIRRMVHIIRGAPSFNPNPMPPSIIEQAFLGNATDGIVSNNKAGEVTPFYISLLSTTSGPNNTPMILRRDTNTTLFPNLTSLIPAPELNPDGSLAPAVLLPLPEQQPIRLYDRGLPTEHYGFYTYFDRSIFLKSTALLDASNLNTSSPTAGQVPDDLNGGSPANAARFRCTWTQTRFLVQMWTRRNGTAALLNAGGQQNFLSSASNQTAAIANDFSKPGSFPYPITITTDRHGGDVDKKMIYCYELDARERVIPGSGKIWPEHRNAGGNGQVINPAPSILVTGGTSSNPSAGGFDGGNTGCSCQWQNWQAVARD